MDEKSSLIDWIHRVEFDLHTGKSTKRLPSLVTEIFFERQLSLNRTLGLPQHIATGWMGQFSWQHKVKEWFKIASYDCDEKKLASQLFIQNIAATSPRDRFYLVGHEVQIETNSSLPKVTFTIRPIIQKNDKSLCLGEADESFGKKLTDAIAIALKNYGGVNPGSEIRPWLNLLDTVELKRLLATRCLMNFSGFSFTDIDGVGIDADGRLTLVEFKRKDPARGMRYRLKSESLEKRNYLKIAKDLNRLATAKLQEHVFSDSRWDVAQDECFGLDTSHATNVVLCESNKWVYRYVIWNHSPATPEHLFTEQLVPRENLDIRVLNVSPQYFDGIAKAPGGKSGTYSVGKVRYQLMIRVQDFDSIVI